MKKELDEHKAVFGKQVPIYRGKKITPRYIWSNFTDDREVNKFSKIENRYFLHNAFCFYTKETLLKYPMPEIYASKEDRYWAKDMVDKKARIEIIKDMKYSIQKIINDKKYPKTSK